MSQQNIAITVQPCAEVAGMNKCPRCLRWTPNDGPRHPCNDGSLGTICWRCQFVLVTEHPDSPATGVVRGWREAQGLPCE